MSEGTEVEIGLEDAFKVIPDRTFLNVVQYNEDERPNYSQSRLSLRDLVLMAVRKTDSIILDIDGKKYALGLGIRIHLADTFILVETDRKQIDKLAEKFGFFKS